MVLMQRSSIVGDDAAWVGLMQYLVTALNPRAVLLVFLGGNKGSNAAGPAWLQQIVQA